MCEKCFDKELEAFDNGHTFTLFEIQLEQKLKQNDGLVYIRPSSEGELIQYTIYSCKNCNTKWYFQIPNTLNVGFFLREGSAINLLLKLKAKDDKQRYIVIGVLFVIMVICFIILAGS